MSSRKASPTKEIQYQDQKSPHKINSKSKFSPSIQSNEKCNKKLDFNNSSLLKHKRKLSFEECKSNTRTQTSTYEKIDNKSIQTTNKITSYFNLRKNLHENSFLNADPKKSEFLEEIIERNNKISDITKQLIAKIKKSKSGEKTGLIKKLKAPKKSNEILQKIKVKSNRKTLKNKETDKIIKNILDGPSLRQRYSNLINRELPLPLKYSKLLGLFECLDLAIDQLKSIKTPRTFKAIKDEIYNKFNKSFTFEDFKKILFVVPHLFIYKWNRKDKENELIIDIPSNIIHRLQETYNENTNFHQLQTIPYNCLDKEMDESIREMRICVFKKVLYFITSEHYQIFLKRNNIKTRFNPYKQKTWHHDFNVHDVPDISMFNISEKSKPSR